MASSARSSGATTIKTMWEYAKRANAFGDRVELINESESTLVCSGGNVDPDLLTDLLRYTASTVRPPLAFRPCLLITRQSSSGGTRIVKKRQRELDAYCFKRRT
jgi:hypothetical protein